MYSPVSRFNFAIVVSSCCQGYWLSMCWSDWLISCCFSRWLDAAGAERRPVQFKFHSVWIWLGSSLIRGLGERPRRLSSAPLVQDLALRPPIRTGLFTDVCKLTNSTIWASWRHSDVFDLLVSATKICFFDTVFFQSYYSIVFSMIIFF